MREYELMLILPADVDDAGVDAVSRRISGILDQRGGEFGQVDQWGRRRLAYEIDRQSEGYYLVIRFTGTPESLTELDRVLSLADDVVRFKVVVRAA